MQYSVRVSTHPEVLMGKQAFDLQAGPSSKGSFFFFYTNKLGFSPEFVGRIQLLDGVAQLAGILLLLACLLACSLRRPDAA